MAFFGYANYPVMALSLCYIPLVCSVWMTTAGMV